MFDDNEDLGSGEEYDFDDDGEDGDNNDEPEEMEESAENLFFQAKSVMEENVEEAVNLLKKVVELDKEDRSIYGFKALKKLLKIELNESKEINTSDVVNYFKDMLSYADILGVNDTEKGINTVIELVWTTQKNKFLELIENLSGLSGECFLRNKNERAWFRTNLKLADYMLEAGEKSKFLSQTQKLTEWCEVAPGVCNPKKESNLLEVIALQMKLRMQDSVAGANGLRRLVSRARGLQSTIPHPRTLGTIHECDGKVMLFEHNWPDAKKEFFVAFKNYDVSGSERRIACLRYIVLAALLEKTTVSPFESPETKSLTSDKDIIPVVELWDSYEKLNVDKFNEYVMRAYAGDEFATSFLPLVRRCFQLQKIIKIVDAFSKVKIQFIAKELKIDENECEQLLAEFILDGKLNSFIDQVHKVLIMQKEGVIDPYMKYNSMTQWSRHVEQVTTAISRKVIKEDYYD